MYTTIDTKYATITEGKGYSVKRGSETNRLYVEICSEDLFSLRQGLKIKANTNQYITTESLRVIHSLAIENGGKQLLVGNTTAGFMKISKDDFTSHPKTLAVSRKT